MTDTFGFLGEFGRIHHRTLNSAERLRALARAEPSEDGTVAVAEGDLCWYENGGDVLAVMYHPNKGFVIPPREEMEIMVRRGEVTRLDEVLAPEFTTIPKVVELKTGKGRRSVALAEIVRRVKASGQVAYWFDTFSPGALREIKRIDPEIPTSLHTRAGVYGPFVIKTAFELVPLLPLSLRRLSQADAVTVTYKYSPSRWLRRFGATIDNVHRAVAGAGKTLILGGVESPETEQLARRSMARAAYLKWLK